MPRFISRANSYDRKDILKKNSLKNFVKSSSYNTFAAV